MPVLYFTVTNDLIYDQRMIRICGSLARNGYDVTLVGRRMKNSKPLSPQPFSQHRLACIFEKGKLFYAEYNIRLFLFLLRKRMDLVCAIDLDSILPCYQISKFRGIKRVYDAHELFCEMKEIVSRPQIYRFWKKVERMTLPHFNNGYTVNRLIADEFKRLYNKDYEVIRSIAMFDPALQNQPRSRFILYQGAVNEGRSFETLLPAMQWVNATLVICGDGNFMEQAKQLTVTHNLKNVEFRGMVDPATLKQVTSTAYIGLTLFEANARSNYYSLANRFFDYIHSGVPQLCVDYPVYRELNDEHAVAVLINDLSPGNIAHQLNSLLEDEERWQQLHQNCLRASQDWNWQTEEQKLLAFYRKILG